MSDLEVDVDAILVFNSYLRIECAVVGGAPNATRVALLSRGRRVAAGIATGAIGSGGGECFVVESLISRRDFPTEYSVEIRSTSSELVVSCDELVALEKRKYSDSLRPTFDDIVYKTCELSESVTLLELGGRARSGSIQTTDHPRCKITVADVIPGPDVDVVADAHELSSALPRNAFDFVVSVSVFEHLLMPWKVAIEINRVMKPGGYVYIHTHQTVGIHDSPWDFYRYSADAWPAFFNKRTGFEILTTRMCDFLHVMSRHYFKSGETPDLSGGFLTSSVIAHKVGDTTLSWDVSAEELYKGAYPK